MQRIGVDVGGTFTDIVVLDARRRLTIRKVLSTPADYSEAIQTGLAQLIRQGSIVPEEVGAVVHAATVATNSVITGSGPRVGLITTEGFRDVLEIGRLRMPRLYDMEWRKPVPLVPRSLRQEVAERMDFQGRVVRPLDQASVRRAVERLLAARVDSIAVCLLHAYANPAHEQAVGEFIRPRAPHLDLSLSHQVLPEVKEYERTSTTVITAYVKPLVRQYLSRLERRLREMAVRAPLMVMHSAGGTMKAATAGEHPAHVIESGPAAGAVGAAEVGRRMGIPNLISFDMGGTTAKACLIEGGTPRLASEFEVGAGVSVGHRLLKGGGYLLRVPAIDLVEIGAGGGSIAWIDKGGILRVGTQSAGADPGPACYRRGGTEPTVTDANVVLGYLNPEYLAGGDLVIDGELARKAIQDRIAAPLGLGLEAAAHGIHMVVNSGMVRAVQAVSSEIGRDPRDFALFAFGGSGPAHAASLAVRARIPSIIVPPGPGVFSATGMLFTTVEHRFGQTFWRNVEDADLAEMEAVLRRLAQEARETLAAEGFLPEEMEFQHTADMRYRGQSSELGVRLPPGPLRPEVVRALADTFQQEHERTFGYRSEGEAIQFVSLRLRARGLSRDPVTPEALALVAGGRSNGPPEPPRSRRAYFGPDHGWVHTPVVSRADLTGAPARGPLIVEEYDSTVAVPPGATAARDEVGNLRIDVAPLL